jgi:ammonium transporter Rh
VDQVLNWLNNARQAKAHRAEDAIGREFAGASLHKSTILLGLLQVLLLVLFGISGHGGELLESGSSGSGTQGYNMFIGVEIMMFIGFGYLMTFMKWHGLTAVGFTMVVTAIGLQWAVLTEAFFDQWYNVYPNWHQIDVNIYSLLNSLYAVSAVLITFGALIGKITPIQLLVVTIIELALHSMNYIVILGGMSVADMGGTYADHMFGAYFGLAVAWVLGKPGSEPDMGAVPDIFSLIGTLFLWVYWPSFVAGAAGADGAQQQRAIVNTILSLSSGTITAFFTSSFFNNDGRFRPVDVQNATLAGGVAIGAVANLSISPAASIFIGVVASLVSTVGYYFIQPWMENTLCIHDTCGIHNLHAMPSVVGGFASVFIALSNKKVDKGIYGSDYASQQWWRQLSGMLIVMLFAIVTGIITGYICKMVGPDEDKPMRKFHDDEYWEVADDYGRTFYTELGLVVEGAGGSTEDRNKVHDLDSSSHHGRRPVKGGEYELANKA